MSLDMNLVIMGGRLTGDPEPLGGSGTGCRFDLATNRAFKNKEGERVEDTTFMPITCWGTLAEIVMNRAQKGSAVVVEGRIEVRKFTGEDEKPRKYVNIVARDVRFADTRSTDTAPSAPAPRSRDTMQLPAGVDPAAAALLQQLLGNAK